MQELITSFIIQAKECKLPGIGKFRVITTPAETDIINHRITPPVVEFLFTGKEDKVSDELVKYVAEKKDISTAAALTEVKDWCSQAAVKLGNDEEILFPSLGALKKGGSGNIYFHGEAPLSFFGPVVAERVIHKNAEHTMIVGDHETTSTAMNRLLSETGEEKKSHWKLMALILFCIGVIVLFLYLYQHSFSSSAIGNQEKVESPSSPAATYSSP
jgi:hypothetical protein